MSRFFTRLEWTGQNEAIVLQMWCLSSWLVQRLPGCAKMLNKLLQINKETRRFKLRNFMRLRRAIESLMFTVYTQPTSRFIRRLRRPGFQHAGWVAVYL